MYWVNVYFYQLVYTLNSVCSGILHLWNNYSCKVTVLDISILRIILVVGLISELTVLLCKRIQCWHYLVKTRVVVITVTNEHKSTPSTVAKHSSRIEDMHLHTRIRNILADEGLITLCLHNFIWSSDNPHCFFTTLKSHKVLVTTHINLYHLMWV